MWFWVGLPNFIQLGPPPAELRRHINFQDGGQCCDSGIICSLKCIPEAVFPFPANRRTTSRCGFSHVTHLSRSKSVSWPNFGQICWDITTTGFWNKRLTYLNSTSGLPSGHIGRFGMIRSIISPSFVDRYPSRPNIYLYLFHNKPYITAMDKKKY